ncbi:MAG: 2-dehydropantoate 2-reductase [Alphaproteobacteria bacterium]|nr:2-dehydropantoate 2-reductase [Alphaproteobacteria bacterium]
MKIAIFGAGAIGGYLGAKLAKAGVDVTLIARGPHLAAIKANGLILQTLGESFTVRPAATDDPAQAGAQDFVFLTIKSNSAPAIAATLKPMLRGDTGVVTAMNGLPFWYFHKQGGPHEGRRLQAVDPHDLMWSHIGPERAIGCVLDPAATIQAPGIIRHTYSDRVPIGEPDGSRSDRIQALSKAMIAAGLKAPVRPRIRTDIWIKLWGNVCFNPLSALTGATLDVLATDKELAPLVMALMSEARSVGEALGIDFLIDTQKRIAGAADAGAHKTSMLQDLESGRPMEIDPIVGAVVEIGRMLNVPTPTIDIVLALVRRRAIEAGCYKPS